MTILSFQSRVAYGHVGHSASVFALQRLGFEVAAIDTVQFSNHPGYGTFTGQVHPPADLADLVRGLNQGGFMGGVTAVLSGYLGDAGTAEVVGTAVLSRPPGVPYLCDPVMGDDGRLYVRPALVQTFAEQLVPLADIVTPNPFELGLLTETAPETEAEVVMAARRLLRRGPSLVVATGLRQGDAVSALAVTANQAWRVTTPWIDFDPPVSGTGDLFSALFLAATLAKETPPAALSAAMSGLFSVLTETRRLGRREMALVQAQGKLAGTPEWFPALAVAG